MWWEHQRTALQANTKYTILLTIITMLQVRSPGLTRSAQLKLYNFDQHLSAFATHPQPLAATVLLSVSKCDCFRFHRWVSSGGLSFCDWLVCIMSSGSIHVVRSFSGFLSQSFSSIWPSPELNWNPHSSKRVPRASCGDHPLPNPLTHLLSLP